MRSRLYVTFGVALGVTLAAALLEYPSLLLPVLAIGVVTVVWGTIQTYLSGGRRRRRFTVVQGFFLALPASPPGLNAVLGLMSVGAFAALTVEERRNDGELAWLLLAATITLAVPIGVQAFLAWQPLFVALTPRGVVWRSHPPTRRPTKIAALSGIWLSKSLGRQPYPGCCSDLGGWDLDDVRSGRRFWAGRTGTRGRRGRSRWRRRSGPRTRR
jgi:hypothetical protein